MSYVQIGLSLALLALALFACEGGSDSSPNESPALPHYDFSAVDTRLQKFLDDSERYDGISITLVDQAQGTVHEAAFGDHTLDIVFLLASASKMPTA